MIINVVLEKHTEVPAGVMEVPVADSPEQCGFNQNCFRRALEVFNLAKENPSYPVRIDKAVYDRTGRSLWSNIFTPGNVFLEENEVARKRAEEPFTLQHSLPA